MQDHVPDTLDIYKSNLHSNAPTGNIAPIPVNQDLKKRIFSNPHLQQGKYGAKQVSNLVKGISPASVKFFSWGLTTQHWLSRLSGINSYRKYCDTINIEFKLPLSLYQISDYLAYLADERRVARDTAVGYLSHLKTLHESLGIPSSNFEDYRIRTICNGIGNFNQMSQKPTNHRRVVTFNVLKCLGHIIAHMNLSELEVTTIWCLCLFLFWGSFRGSEVLPQGKAPHQIAVGLRWRNIQAMDNRLVVHLPTPKNPSKKNKGSTVDLLLCPDQRYCPVSYFYKLLNLSKKYLTLDNNDHIFLQANLTNPIYTYTFNYFLKKHLNPHFPNNTFSQYSFRAGLVVEIASRSDEFPYSTQLSMGRWQSEAVDRYKRLSGRERTDAITKIMDLLTRKVWHLTSLFLSLSFFFSFFFPFTLLSSS